MVPHRLFFTKRVKQTMRGIGNLGDVLINHRKTGKLRWGAGKLFVEVEANGSRLLVHPLDNGIGRPLYTGQPFEPAETAFVKRSLRDGMVFVDIGANIGYFTTLASPLVGPSGKVIAIEPAPGNYQLLKLNIDRNRLSNVTARACALGPDRGETRLFLSFWNFGNHRVAAVDDPTRASVTVPVERGDDLLAEYDLTRIDLIKIDVEGYEPYVVRGMNRTLERAPLTVLTEFCPHALTAAGVSPKTYFESFIDRGFKAHTLLDDGSIRGVTWDGIDKELPPERPNYPEGWFMNLVFQK